MLYSSDKPAVIPAPTPRPPVFTSLQWVPVYVKTIPRLKLLPVFSQRMATDPGVQLKLIQMRPFQDESARILTQNLKDPAALQG